jgi:hypothetical protein
LQGDGDIPRGALVYGRVSRIINFNDYIPSPKPEHSPPPKEAMPGQHSGEVLIQIEFEHRWRYQGRKCSKRLAPSRSCGGASNRRQARRFEERRMCHSADWSTDELARLLLILGRKTPFSRSQKPRQKLTNFRLRV